MDARDRVRETGLWGRVEGIGMEEELIGRGTGGGEQQDLLSKSLKDDNFYSETFDLCFGEDDVAHSTMATGTDVSIDIGDDVQLPPAHRPQDNDDTLRRMSEQLLKRIEEELGENRGEAKEKQKKKKVLSVIGSGDYGRAIAGRIAQCDYTVLVGSRDPFNPAIRDLLSSKPGTQLVAQDQAMREAEIVLIAVVRDHYHKLPSQYLQGKIVIDVANNTSPRSLDLPSNAEVLQTLLPKSRVVKAFNVLSAYALENSDQQGAKQIPIASDDTDAKRIVMDLAKTMGYTPLDCGPLVNARKIEAIPLKLLPTWRTPLKVVAGMWILHYFLLLVKFQICKNVSSTSAWDWHSFRHLGLLNINRASAITALWTLASCYLPGVIAAYTQLAWGTKYRRFPSWLDTWLRMRKQLGLLMLAVGAIHTVLGVAVWSAQYDELMWDDPTLVRAEVRYNDTAFMMQDVPVFNGQMNWQGELFLTTGTLSIFLTCILGVTSLPSVGATLSWREFMFVQSKLGWMALILATLHDGLLGFGFRKEDFTCSLPSGAQYALHVPLLVILLKLPLLCPCVDRRLQSIRQGHDRPGAKRYSSSEKPLVAVGEKRRKRVHPILVQPFTESFRTNDPLIHIANPVPTLHSRSISSGIPYNVNT